ncbi:type II toxin-antitoxin system VapC family toxin [Brevifollis gellanilyticus]|uniref:Ribonuclease VapC n=1 Tax=Brevifollis gellanilyticus TaxID=748831 RepID=A0A512MHQ2_9BACT|nr:PIN domain-containing protein [Brevifollis gellanilyticus]GEP46254.1 hypothetical protein BGE01nite_55450 [Brevifollis gellanilyticus]
MSQAVTHVLDTSALLAHYLEEPGFDLVETLTADPQNHVCISSVTWLEFRVRLEQLVADAATKSRTLDIYRALLGEGIPVNDAISNRALLLRQSSQGRLPNMDALIAATAAEHGAILVHRDPHMAGIPTTVVAQLVLPDK